MQLHGTLRSFLLHCHDANIAQIYVIFRATNARHLRQYDRLSEELAENSSIHFVKEENFRHDVLSTLIEGSQIKFRDYLSKLLSKLDPRLCFIINPLLKSKNTNYVLFLVDDNIFVRNFSLHEIGNALATNPAALGFSLRLGRNTTYCYPLDKPQSMPQFKTFSDNMLIFDWTEADFDFSYPLELSSSAYRINDLLPLLNRLPFTNPNTMEGSMAKQASKFKMKKPYLLCYSQSVAFCNPLNRVQNVALNRAGSTSKNSAENLAQLFDEGYRIKIEAYNEHMPNACHQEVDLIIETHEI
jgi:hypothetical protein